MLRCLSGLRVSCWWWRVGGGAGGGDIVVVVGVDASVEVGLVVEGGVVEWLVS
jgi:hypothetical protein